MQHIREIITVKLFVSVLMFLVGCNVWLNSVFHNHQLFSKIVICVVVWTQ